MFIFISFLIILAILLILLMVLDFDDHSVLKFVLAWFVYFGTMVFILSWSDHESEKVLQEAAIHGNKYEKRIFM